MEAGQDPEDDHGEAKGAARQLLSDVLQTCGLRRIVSKQAARETLELIDAIHAVMGLPVIPMTCNAGRGQVSSSFRSRPNRETGEVENLIIRLFVSDPDAKSLRPVASLLHEIAHAIDLLAFGNREPLCCSETHLEWNDWRKAVVRSEHVKELTGLASNPPYRPGAEPLEKDFLFEAMAWRNRQLNELWARSYRPPSDPA